jgi:hypothetical protein
MKRIGWRPLAVFAFYLAVIFAVYGSFLTNPFLMDDEIQILHNRHVQTLDNWPTFFTSSTMDEGGAAKMAGVYYKPLMSTFFAVCWTAFGDDPSGFRAPLWVLHAASAFFIYLFSTAFFPFLLSVSLGLLFLLHPVNAEVVLYIADAQDILYMFFGLLALVVTQRLKAGVRLYVALLVIFSAALLSKETGALFMAFAALYAWIFDRPKLKPVVAAAISVTLTYLVIRNAIGLTHVGSEQLFIYHATFLQRLSMLPLILAHYIEILFVPLRLSLATDFVIEKLTVFNFALPLAVVFGALAALTLEKRALVSAEQKKIFWFFIFVLLGWLTLHGQTLVALDGVYVDRWLYIGVWAFLSLIALALQSVVQKRPRFKRPIGCLVVALVGVSMARDRVRAQDFANPLRLYRRELSLHPWDAIMSNNVGVELFRAGDWQGSRKYFELSSRNNPIWNVSWNNLGAVEERAGKNAEALELYKKSFGLGGYSLAVENYGKLLCKLGRLKECRAHVNLYLEIYPYNPTLLTLKERLRL